MHDAAAVAGYVSAAVAATQQAVCSARPDLPPNAHHLYGAKTAVVKKTPRVTRITRMRMCDNFRYSVTSCVLGRLTGMDGSTTTDGGADAQTNRYLKMHQMARSPSFQVIFFPSA